MDILLWLSIILLVAFVLFALPWERERIRYERHSDTYPRIIGYDGVFAKGNYYDCDGFWVPPHFEHATVEVSPRYYIVMDTLEALRQGIPEQAH